MRDDSEVYVGLDTSKLKISVAVAAAGRDGEVRFFGDIDSTPEAVERLVRKLAQRHQRLFFAYEAGPTGYGLQRQIAALGHDCAVVAPSLIPKRPGERVKTNAGTRWPWPSCIERANSPPSGFLTRRMRPYASWCARGRPRWKISAPNDSTCNPSCFGMAGSMAAAAPGAGRIRDGSASYSLRTLPSTWSWPSTGRPLPMPRSGWSA
jgi:hypothetical protein